MRDGQAVLVTGGAGYIGSFVVRACLLSGRSVVALDDGSKGHFEAVRRAGADLADGALVHAVRGRVGDGELIRSLVREHDIEACVHLAGRSLVAESVADPLTYYDSNVGQGLNLLSALVASGVKRFVFSSSAAVYGHPATVPIAEDEPLLPINPYGETKMVMELALRRLHEAYGLTYAALRYFNAAGADEAAGLGEDHHPESHLVPLAVDAALGLRGALTVFGRDYPTPDGTCIRDYVDVRDIAQAHIAALDVLQAGGSVGPVNLGTGTGFSVLEVLDAVEVATGRAVPHVFGDRRPGDPAVLVASGERARHVLGWAPAHSLASSVAAAAGWREAWPQGYPNRGA